MTITDIDGNIVFEGKDGVLMLLNFLCGELPKEAVSSKCFATVKDQSYLVKIANRLATESFSVSSMRLGTVYFDEAHYVDCRDQACIMAVEAGDYLVVCTNIANQNVFDPVFKGIVSAALSLSGKDRYHNLSDEQLQTVLEGASSEIVKEIVDIRKQMQEKDLVARKCISIPLFAHGVIAITCSSKEEYMRMKEFFKEKDFVISKSVNENGWGDVCKYVFAEAVNDDVIALKSSFRLPDTVDGIMSFAAFKKESDTLTECGEFFEKMKDKLLEMQNALKKKEN